MHTWNEMEAGWTPKLESCRCSQKAMGFEMSTAMVETEVGLDYTATRIKCVCTCYLP